MLCVYYLRSLKSPNRTYTGITRNLYARLAQHNAGKSAFTSHYRPWKLVAAIYLADEARAMAFEKYLKFGSGHAFARRHFFS